MSAGQGDRKAGNPDRGSPMKVGGKYSATAPTYDDGDRVEARFDSRGNLCVVMGSGATAADIAAGSADDSAASNAGLFVNARQYVYDGAAWDRLRTATTFKIVAAQAITAGTGIVIWTPTAGKKFRLLGYCFSSSAAASLIFCDHIVGTPIFRSPLLAAAGLHDSPPLGNGLLSATINNVLRLDVSATSTVTGTVWGTEE